MRNRAYYNDHRWRLIHGVPEVDKNKFLLQELRDTEWSYKFENLMRHRLILGALRYCRIIEKFPVYDRIGRMEECIKSFKKTGNTEFLVDIANYALLEFEKGFHCDEAFNPIDDGDHASLK